VDDRGPLVGYRAEVERDGEMMAAARVADERYVHDIEMQRTPPIGSSRAIKVEKSWGNQYEGGA
jgi:hypothetical protein